MSGPLQRIGLRFGLMRAEGNALRMGIILGLFAWGVLIMLAFLHGVGVRDPGINQPGARGNVGVGAPGVGVSDPGINQPGAMGNTGPARRSIRR